MSTIFALPEEIFSVHQENYFQKKLSKTDLLFRFCKLGLWNALLIFDRKMAFCLFCFFAILCTILTYFFLIEAPINLKKMLSRKKIVNVWLGNCSTLRVLRWQILQIKKDAIDITSRQKVHLRQTFFSKWSTTRAL